MLRVRFATRVETVTMVLAVQTVLGIGCGEESASVEEKQGALVSGNWSHNLLNGKQGPNPACLPMHK